MDRFDTSVSATNFEGTPASINCIIQPCQCILTQPYVSSPNCLVIISESNTAKKGRVVIFAHDKFPSIYY